MKQSCKRVLAFGLCFLVLLGYAFTAQIFADFSFELGYSSLGQSTGGKLAAGVSGLEQATPPARAVTDISNDTFSYLTLYSTGYTYEGGTYMGPVNGTVFELYKKDEADGGKFKPYSHSGDSNNGIYTTATQTFPMYVSATNSVQHITRDGTIHIGGLPHGIYRLVVVQTPPGYASSELLTQKHAEFQVLNIRDPQANSNMYVSTFANYLAREGGIHFRVISNRIEDYMRFRYPYLAWLQGAVFEVDAKANGVWNPVEDNHGNAKQWISDAAGYVEIKGLEVGIEHRLRQVTAPHGFEPMPAGDRIVTLFMPTENSNGNMLNLEQVINAPEEYYFRLKAKDEKNNGQGIEGMSFAVFASPTGSKTLDADWVYLKDLPGKTDSDGLLEFSIPYMPGVTFRLAESAVSGKSGKYILSSNNPYQTGVIDLDVIGTTNPGAPVEIPVLYTYEDVTSTITLIKYDSTDKHKVLADANFVLYRQGSNGWQANNYSYITNAEGKIRITLPPGTYKFKETSAPPNYIGLEGDGFTETFTISDTGILTIGRTISDTMMVANQYDESVTYKKATLIKVDADSKKTLEGASFFLEKKDADGNYTPYQSSLTTNSTGKIEVELPYGDYRMWEVEAPEGYVLSGGYTAFTIDDFTPDGMQREISNIEKAAHIIYGDVTIIKHNVHNWSVTLEGAVFTLERKSGTQWEDYMHGIVTDASGEAHINALPAGEYRLKEEQAPHGYRVNDDNAYLFVVAADGYDAQEADFAGDVVTPSEAGVFYIANEPVSISTGTGKDKYPGSSIPDDHDSRDVTVTEAAETGVSQVNVGESPQVPLNVNDNPGTGRA